jgi:hypothetical protein
MNTRLLLSAAMGCAFLCSGGVCPAAEKSNVQSGPNGSPATLSIEVTDQPRRMLDAWDILGGVEVSMSSVNENYIGFHDLKHSKFNTLYGSPKIGPSRYFRKQSLVSSWTFQHGDGWLIGDMNFVLTRNKLDQDEFGPATLHMTLSGSSGPQSWTNEGTTKLEFKVRPVLSGKGYLPGTNWAYELHLVFPETLHVSNEGAVLEDLYCDTPNVSLLGSRPLYLGADTINSLVTGGFPPAFGPYNVWSAEKLVFQSNQVRDVVGTLNYTLEMSEEDKLSDVQARVDEDQRKAKLDDVPWKTARDVSFGGEKVEDRPIGLISEQWLYYWHSDFETYGDFYEEHGRVRFNVPEALRMPGAVYRGRVLEYFYADTADHPVITAVHEAVLKEGQWQSAAIVGAKATEDGFTILQAFSAMAEIAQPHSTIALPSADPASDTCPNEYRTARPVIAKQDVVAPGYGTRSVLTGSLSLQQINLTDAQNSLSRLNYYFPGATAKWSVLPGATAQVRLWLWTDDGSALGKWHLVGITENLAPYYGSTTSYLFAEALTPGRATVRITLTIGGQEIRDDLEIKCEPPELAVDANRDGTIKLSSEDSTDTTSSEKPYRFWINDDISSGDTGGDSIPGQTVTMQDGEIMFGFSPDYATTATGPTADTSSVRGTRDLVDYFPVYMDIKQLLDILPSGNGVTYKLKQADGAVNVVFTNLRRSETFNYLRPANGPFTTGFGPELSQAAESATKHHVTSDGLKLFEVSPLFLDCVQNHDGGVVLIDGRAAATNPLVLSVEKDDRVIFEVKLDLRISGVEQMFRHLNLYGATGGTIDVPSRASAPNYPDTLTNGKNFVFVHGYNVDQQQARGWAAEMFKRLWWSGNKAKFYAVSWQGAVTQIGSVTRNYHANVINAFGTAQPLAQFLTTLRASAEVVVAAHSLGNVAVSSAIHDYGAPATKYIAIDAAMAIEAFDGAATPNLPNMRHPDWAGYDQRLWATEWHSFFAGRIPVDRRAELTWRGRLSNALPKTWNVFSSGEEVLDNAQDNYPAIDGVVISGIGRYAWALQEKLKGKLVFGYALGSKYGGWGFGSVWTNGGTQRPPPQSSLSEYPDRVWRAVPLFNSGASALSFLFDPDPNSDTPEYRVSDAFFTSNYNGYTANQLLAQMFPALTYAVGKNEVEALKRISLVRNIDMNALKPHGWPRTDVDWHHSDIREVSYLYTQAVFDQLTSIGELK